MYIIPANVRADNICNAVYKEVLILRELGYFKEALRSCESVPLYNWNTKISRVYLALIVGDLDGDLSNCDLTAEQLEIAKQLESEAKRLFELEMQKWKQKDPDELLKIDKDSPPSIAHMIASVLIFPFIVIPPIVFIGSAILFFMKGLIFYDAALTAGCSLIIWILAIFVSDIIFKALKMKLEVKTDEREKYLSDAPLYTFYYFKSNLHRDGSITY